jgi:hypothetical protein
MEVPSFCNVILCIDKPSNHCEEISLTIRASSESEAVEKAQVKYQGVTPRIRSIKPE